MTGKRKTEDGRPCEEEDMFYFNSENADSEKTLVASICTEFWGWSGKKFTLHCPNDEKVQVIRAFYGYWSWGDDNKKCGYASGDCITDAATPACFSNDCVVTAERSSFSTS